MIMTTLNTILDLLDLNVEIELDDEETEVFFDLDMLCED